MPNKGELDKSRIKGAVVLKVGSPNAFVNGESKKVDTNNPQVAPVIKEGRTLVPVRFISESLGSNVDWDGATSTITITKDGSTVKLILNSTSYFINDAQKELDVPAVSENGRTLIPLRAMAEALGKKVFWDNKGLIVISDSENILSSQTDAGYIDGLIKVLGN